MIYLELVAWVIAITNLGIAFYHDWNDNDIKTIKHTLLAFMVMWAISGGAT